MRSPGLPDRHVPHPRARDRQGNGSEERDGRAIRTGGRMLSRARRVDAHLRRRAALHGRLRDRGRQPPDRRRARAGLGLPGLRRGHRLHVRRRRVQHRQLRRDHEPRRALEAAARLPGREQPLRHGHLDRAPLGRHRPLAKGGGPRSAGRPGGRHGRARGARDRRRAPPNGASRAPAHPRRSIHLPLSRPLSGRPRGLQDQGGGGGVAQEGPGQGLPRPFARRGRDLRGRGLASSGSASSGR